ncbi:MAG TPA: TonB-dependent receptor [Bryobacteraceae bacterium]
MSISHIRVVFFTTFIAASAAGQTTQPQKPQNQTPLPPLKTTVTVNATLSTETPASVTVLPKKQVQDTSGIELDDRLRQVAGFSLFRRSSSEVANPTTQGVSLRATGSSGASRTLVLWDGIPINDPFGGWVYWDRIDPNYIQEIEIDRGAPTSVFGDRAMDGTISIFSPPPEPHHLFLNYLGGNENTQDASGAYSNLWGHWGLTLHSRDFTTDGYYIVPAYLRGTADARANVRFATGDVHLDYLGAHDRLAVHLDILAEERHNGTQLTRNSTSVGTIGATYAHTWTNDEISVIGFHTQGQLHQNFSSVSLDRNSERVVAKQTVPETDTGGAIYWKHHGHQEHFTWDTVVGTDADHTHGISYDYSYFTNVTTPDGGTLFKHGVFGQANLTMSRVTLYGGIRQEYTGEHGQSFVSPNAGMAVGLGHFRLRAAGYRSFRAPTLNELYRPFRVGNVLTDANAALVPEGLTGEEAGFDWSAENTRFSLTLFHDDLDNLIDNATLSETPTLILRQRQNFPSALSRGMEASIDQHWRQWTFHAGYVFADARLSTGARIPQVPKQQGTAELIYRHKSTMISGGLRALGLAFDDDLNQFLLPGFATVGVTAEQHLTGRLSALVSVDNLLDRSYLVALTPNPNIGSPRIWRIGLRWSGGL